MFTELINLQKENPLRVGNKKNDELTLFRKKERDANLYMKFDNSRKLIIYRTKIKLNM